MMRLLLRYSRSGFYIGIKTADAVLSLDRNHLALIIRVLRLHVWTTPKLEKVNDWLNRIIPGSPRLEVTQTDYRCLVLGIPGPSGIIWWNEKMGRAG